MFGARAALCVAALWAAAGGAAAGGCGVAEFACRGGGCVRLDRYCDGAPHCADGSDEPPRCSVCNRTYYGEAGLAYSLTVKGAARAPFLCHLTFTAGGGAHGDLVQLAFDEFRVGRYEAGALDGCPDGYMQLSELGRPFTGGSWCGAADGTALYYSETATVTVSVKLFRVRLGENFGFHLRYKFIAQRDAIVRFGALGAPVERGAVSPGTYCTRTYEECHRKACRLQSPNYPGMYPRNVTCYWSLRQKDIPTCKHAMISIRQEYSHKMQIKRSIAMASLNKTGRAVRAWRECTGERDRLIVYDGASTDDPVLIEYCGGDWLPRVTSRGPDMLVAFHSSPFSAPPRPAPAAAPLRGFELDVDVIFADSDSLDYAREARRCEFHVKASSAEEEGNVTGTVSGRGRRGRLRAPQHTLPPSTTCSWTFHGRPGDVVWLYFSSFTQYSLVEGRRQDSGERDEEAGEGRALRTVTTAAAEGRCAVELRMWEGGGAASGGSLVWRYCDAPPPLCARAALANATRLPRPCAPPDGYVSKASMVSLSATTMPGTATHPLSFELHYEFVDARLEGAPLVGARGYPAACARLLTAPGEFSSPRNVLWFGRGGARRLRCVYRLQAPAGVRLELNLTSAAFGANPHCTSRLEPRFARTICSPLPGPADTDPQDVSPSPLLDDFESGYDVGPLVPHLQIYEAPWPGYRVPVACLCDNASTPLRLVAASGALELELVSGALSPREDHRHLHFRGAWQGLPAPPAGPCAQRRYLSPPGGHIHLTFPFEDERESECGNAPFLMPPRGNRSVFLRVWGYEIPEGSSSELSCKTVNRVLIYDATSGKLLTSVCPLPVPGVGQAKRVWGERRHALLAVWAASEPGRARISWMEAPRVSFSNKDEERNASALCPTWCAPISVCMDPELWCDGYEDCPGAFDEIASARCGAAARLLAVLGTGGAAATAVAVLTAAVVALMVVAALRRARARAGKRALAALAGGRRLTEELLYDASRTSTAS